MERIVKHHVCSNCHQEFPITWRNRVWNSPKYLLYPFHGPGTQIRLFSAVRCPNCGKEEYDPSIRFLGVFPPQAIVWLLLLFLAVAVLDAVLR
jgi:DNA-directed RNA polymerase subunit RPC12/RpoP